VYTVLQQPSASVLERCASDCHAAPACVAFEVGYTSGRCELWTKVPGATAARRNFECFRLEGARGEIEIRAAGRETEAGSEKRTSVVLTDIDAQARCVDGSPASAWVSYVTGSEQTVIIYLEGGGWCGHLSAEDCYRTYSRGQPPSMTVPAPFQKKPHNGLLAAGVAFVFIPQCTGDAYAGDGSKFGLEFRGRRLVAAAYRHLSGRLRRGHGVALAGCSSGARGALYNAEMVRGLVEANGGSFLGVVLNAPLAVTQPHQARRAYEKLPLQGSEGTACAEAHRDEPWLCLLPHVRLRYESSRTLLLASIFDTMADRPPSGYRETVVDAARRSSASWITSCAMHCFDSHPTASVDCVSFSRAAAMFLNGSVFHATDGNATGPCPCTCDACGGGPGGPASSRADAPAGAAFSSFGFLAAAGLAVWRSGGGAPAQAL